MRGLRDDAQRADVCFVFSCWLIEHGAQFVPFVDDPGPSLAARKALRDKCDERGCALSTSQLVILGLMFDVWDGGGRTRLIDLNDLDTVSRLLVGDLMRALALGPDFIDNWVATGKGMASNPQRGT